MEQNTDIQILDELYSGWLEDLSDYRKLRAKEHVETVKLKQIFEKLLSSADSFNCFTKRVTEHRIKLIDKNADKLDLKTQQRRIILDLFERLETVSSEWITAKDKFLLHIVINDSEKDVYVNMIEHFTGIIYILLKALDILIIPMLNDNESKQERNSE